MNNVINYGKLIVLRDLNANPLIYTLLHPNESHAAFLGELYERGGENDLSGLLSEIIIANENILSRDLAKGTTPSDYVISAFKADVNAIFEAAENRAKNGGFNLGKSKYDFNDIKGLSEFYRRNGYGIFIGNIAFYFNGEILTPVKNPSKTRLNELKDYESEKNALIFNVENFLKDLPYGNTLLYGDRGTGKSSTVQAVLNEYAKNGLRLIQLDKKYIDKLNDVRALVDGNPLKFIIFIDDLSLSQETAELSAFKAALEGSMSSSDNTMVIATSNRRHIVKESYADRQNDLHPEDGVQDSISLSDRFAITIMFSSTGKSEYLSIVKQLAEDENFYNAELDALAERWALMRGGRSPRVARQFCDYAFSCVKRGVNIDF